MEKDIRTGGNCIKQNVVLPFHLPLYMTKFGEFHNMACSIRSKATQERKNKIRWFTFQYKIKFRRPQFHYIQNSKCQIAIIPDYTTLVLRVVDS
jgi:hypothetical protein